MFTFWKEVGGKNIFSSLYKCSSGKKEDVQSAEAGGDDADAEVQSEAKNKLFL